MIDDIQHEQAALYALDALPADEAARFRALVRETPELADLVAEYETASALCAETLPPVPPPPALRGRILAAIAEKSSPSEAAPVSAHWLPWGIAAALAIATGTLWLQNQRLGDANTALGEKAVALGALQRDFAALQTAAEDRARANVALRRQVAELQQRNTLAETQIATLTSKFDASYLASIAWDNTAQKGILEVRRLPAAERGKDYQLWVIDPKNAAPVSAGTFTVAADGSATIRFAPAQRVSAATAFAVSLEKSGGSAAPEGPIVLGD